MIHRDLKPANVQVATAGTVKVLDFGLAKPLDPQGAPDPSESPTMMAATGAGMIMGTAPYMSPEQARGQPVDKRSDIWSFGCVLYEMLAGKPPFSGETASDVMAAIIKEEPEWASLPEATPSALRRLLDRCLTKDPHERLHDIADARIEVKRAIDDPEGGMSRADGSGEVTKPLSYLGIGLAGLAAGAALVLVIMGWSTGSSSTGGAPRHVRLADIEGLTYSRDQIQIAISPDGRRLAFTPVDAPIQVLDLALGDEFEPIPGTEGAMSPFFSPAGQLGFQAVNNRLTLIPQGGGRPQAVPGATSARLTGASWSGDDRILFTPAFGGTVMQVPVKGGTPEPLFEFEEGEISHSGVSMLPDGEHVLYSFWDTDWRIGVRSLTSGRRTIVVDRGQAPRFAPTGHLVFVRGDALMAAMFDPDTLETGEPIQLLDGVLARESDGVAAYAFSAEGTLVYLVAAGDPEARLLRFDFDGGVRPLSDVRADFGTADYGDLDLSPDGQRLAIAINDPIEGEEVWVYDLDRDDMVPIAQGEAWDHFPVFSPDGQRIAYSSERLGSGDVFFRAADGSGPETAAIVGPVYKQVRSWSPDGLIAVSQRSRESEDTWVYPLDDPDAGAPFVATIADEDLARFSPDGRYIVYQSDKTGRNEIYVAPYPSGPDVYEWKVTTGGGLLPRWSEDGTQIFYRSGASIFVADVVEEDRLRTTSPLLLLEGVGDGDWDVSSERRFLIAVEPRDLPQPHMVFNWFEELKRLVPTDP